MQNTDFDHLYTLSPHRQIQTEKLQPWVIRNHNSSSHPDLNIMLSGYCRADTKPGQRT
jgi:hypothetical protein